MEAFKEERRNNLADLITLSALISVTSKTYNQ